MKTKNIILTVIVLLVSNIAMAQFTYQTDKCKDSQIRPANKGEWQHVEGTKYRPLTANPQIYEATEKCSHFYGKISAGGTFETSKSKFAPVGELAAGYTACRGMKTEARNRLEAIEREALRNIALASSKEIADNIAAKALQKMDAIKADRKNYRQLAFAFEVKAGITKMHGLEYKGLTTVKEKYTPYIGGNVYLILNKHSDNQISLYGGAAYARVSSLYPSETEGTAVRKVGHNTLSVEGGLQYLHKLSYGNAIGGKVFYNNISTEHVNQAVVGVALVYKFNKVHKSEKMSFKDWQNANEKINKARKASLVNSAR